MKQRDAVFKAVIEVMGEQEGAYEPTKSQREDIVELVTAGICAGHVDFSESASEKYNTEAKVRSYTKGMVSNWLRKDTRLNGGSKYVPANPGSRAGFSDPEIKNLRLLKKTLTDQSKIAIIDQAIEAKQAELQAEKAKQVEIDFDALPSELLAQLGLDSE